MTPAARVQAAIDILDRILAGDPAEQALLRWSRASRFAGSGDRAAVRDLVFDSLRRLRSRAALGGTMTGRGLMLGMCHEEGRDLHGVFTGDRHAPAALSGSEQVPGIPIDGAMALDLPDWVFPLWRDALGDAAGPVAVAMRDRAPVWLRANTLRTGPGQVISALAGDGIEVRCHPELPTALCVTAGARRVAGSAAYRDGLVELQDLSPQLACSLLPARGTVLDYCAGGGGKALALAAQGARAITCHDVDPQRMNDLPVRARRAGADISIARPGGVSGQYDLVVADVPCSGSGTWRRTPDAKWRLQEQDLTRLVSLQAGILDEVAGFVAPGGLLAYMTCSILRCENQQQIASFLQDRPGFRLTQERIFTPLNDSDGFYLCTMQRC